MSNLGESVVHDSPVSRGHFARLPDLPVGIIQTIHRHPPGASANIDVNVTRGSIMRNRTTSVILQRAVACPRTLLPKHPSRPPLHRREMVVMIDQGQPDQEHNGACHAKPGFQFVMFSRFQGSSGDGERLRRSRCRSLRAKAPPLSTLNCLESRMYAQSSTETPARAATPCSETPADSVNPDSAGSRGRNHSSCDRPSRLCQ